MRSFAYMTASRDEYITHGETYNTSVLTITKFLLSSSISFEAANFGFKTENNREVFINMHSLSRVSVKIVRHHGKILDILKRLLLHELHQDL